MSVCGFPPVGGLSLRLSLAVTAALRGEIHEVGGVDVRAALFDVAFFIGDASRRLSPSQKQQLHDDLGLFCLVVACHVLPLMGSVSDESGAVAGAGKRSAAPAGAGALSSTLPHGNHGENNLPASAASLGEITQ